MDLKQLYIENCEGFDEYMPDGSCRNGLRMTLDGFQNALRKFSGQIEPRVKPVDYGTCKNCIFNLEESETSLISECQLTIDEFTGIGLQFSRDFGCNQWQSKPSV